MVDISLLAAKIAFAVAEIIFKYAMLNSSVAKMTFVLVRVNF